MSSTPLQFRIPLPRPRSQRTRAIARWFGLKPDVQSKPIPRPASCDVISLIPQPGELVLITGASGSGKSSLLRAIRATLEQGTIIDLNRIRLRPLPVVDCFGPAGTSRVLRILSRVGLSEAWTYLRTPDELSEGQRWRLRLGIALYRLNHRSDSVLLADEFAALLDRVTAGIIARALRRAIHAINGRAIVATAHDDLVAALQPDRIIKCDFGTARVTHGAGPIRRTTSSPTAKG